MHNKIAVKIPNADKKTYRKFQTLIKLLQKTLAPLTQDWNRNQTVGLRPARNTKTWLEDLPVVWIIIIHPYEITRNNNISYTFAEVHSASWQ